MHNKPLKFFINLARDQVRASAMTQAFVTCKYQPERFDAVDWRALPTQEQQHFYHPELNKKGYFRGLTAGECGCYASHLKICRLLLDSDANWALILEDDVEPDPSFDAVMDAIDALPAHWDMIKLIGRTKEKVANQFALSSTHQFVQYSRIPILASAYIVSRSGAQKMLNGRQPFARPIDVDMRWWWENDLRVFGVLPYPVRLASTSDVSTIGDRKGPRDLWTRLGKAWVTLQYNMHLLATARRQSEFWKQLTR